MRTSYCRDWEQLTGKIARNCRWCSLLAGIEPHSAYLGGKLLTTPGATTGWRDSTYGYRVAKTPGVLQDLAL